MQLLRRGIGQLSFRSLALPIAVVAIVALARPALATSGNTALLLKALREIKDEVAGLRQNLTDCCPRQNQMAAAEPSTRPSPTKPRVTVTRVPPVGSGPTSRGDIAGRVEGVAEPDQYKIVLYAHPADDWWYVQPLRETADAPGGADTRISPDGAWNNWTHLGLRYAAMLVKASFKAPDRALTLPTVGGDVLAIDEVEASK